MRILSFGEILFDVYGDSANLGGAPLNFCAHAVRAGAQASMLSAVGADDYGSIALKQIQSYGIDIRHTAVLADKMTGKCLVTLNDQGVPRYNLLEGVAYDYIPVPKLEGERFDVLYFGTLALRSDYNRNTIETLLQEGAAKDVFVDVNIRPPFYCDESILLALNHATLLKISDEELHVVAETILGAGEHSTDAVIAAIKEKFPNVKLLILTCGAEGSVAYDLKTGAVNRCDAVKTKVVSTVGAGDSFCATFIANYLQGVDTMTALQKASKVSAWVVSQEGAIPDGVPQM